jgi:hypothetical protein
MLIMGFVPIVLVIMVIALNCDGRRRGKSRSVAAGRVLVGVLGDSDSAAYQDTLLYSGGTSRPGGDYHPITFQWPEVLARIRSREVDLGEWAIWGVPRWMSMARVRDGLGLTWRAPHRETHQHNLAWASGCQALTSGALRQAPRLVDVMDEQPVAWRSGVVVIRSGVNDFGKKQALDALANCSDDPEVLSQIDACVVHVRTAVDLIHERHPETSIVLVGILNNSDLPSYFDLWQSPEEQRNLNRGLDHFDNALRAMADADSRLAFFDDRAWFASYWGQRSLETGRPNYRTIKVSEALSVSLSVGNSPNHAILANGHAGLVWNTLWSQALVDLVRAQFELPVGSISDLDVGHFADAQIAALSLLNRPLGS